MKWVTSQISWDMLVHGRFEGILPHLLTITCGMKPVKAGATGVSLSLKSYEE